MAKIIRRAVLGGVAVAAVLGSSLAAWAEGSKLRVAYFLADSMLPALYAQDKGYFAEAGLEPEFIAVQGGPAGGMMVMDLGVMRELVTALRYEDPKLPSPRCVPVCVYRVSVWNACWCGFGVGCV